MGRKPSRWKHLPAGMRARPRGRKVFFYFDAGGRPRREIPLGSDYITACQRWAELARGTRAATPRAPTFADACDLYRTEELPKKASRTQKEYLYAIRRLGEFFGDGPLDLIEPRHWEEYAAKRTPISATHEKATFSAIWKYAIRRGYTKAENPTRAWTGTTSKRKYAMRDDVYAAIYAYADQTMRDAMDLAYLTGQRPSDVRKMTRADVVSGYLLVDQQKTGERVRIEVVGELAALLDRFSRRTVGTICQSLVVTEKGRPLTEKTLRYRYNKARTLAAADRANAGIKAAIEAAQFRDLRAKSATDDEEGAQSRLGHTTPAMTARYIRRIAGRKARPTK